MKKLYKTKGRLFSRELGIMERLKYLWEIYVKQNGKEPTTIVLTKEEYWDMFGKYGDLRKSSKGFFTYRGIKVISK